MKAYLGDGVYVDRSEWGQIVLTTEDGISATNVIYLEPEVYAALKAYVEQPQKKSSVPNVGDVVAVTWNGEVVVRAVEQVGAHPPYVDCLMVQGIHHWFPIRECVVPDINNHLPVPFEEDQECPNCQLGTLEKQGNDVYVCRGECGSFFRGPCQHPNRNMNGGCDDCGDPSL